MNEIKELEDVRSEIGETIWEGDKYNSEKVESYLNMGKKINYQKGALRRMIIKIFDVYYGGDAEWLRNKDTFDLINDFKKTFQFYA